MKNTILILAFLFSILSFGQSHITFEKLPEGTKLILLVKELEGTIEIDGHIFDNKKSKDPIVIKATIEGVAIYDKKRKYSYRKCSLENCKTIHLGEKWLYNTSIRITPTSSFFTNSN
ncbi:hypothetical protein ACM55G_14760 [Flavobacterium sp. LB3P122]|uniref:hypothetical protein n=1 Tax=Flavobacterium algoriphilum TaxID=3398738 RepID=UPI003A8C06C8